MPSRYVLIGCWHNKRPLVCRFLFIVGARCVSNMCLLLAQFCHTVRRSSNAFVTVTELAYSRPAECWQLPLKRAWTMDIFSIRARSLRFPLQQPSVFG